MWWMKLKNRHFTHKSTEKKRKRNNVLHKEKKTIMIFFCIVICTLSYQSHDNYGLKLLEHLNPLKVCVEMTGGNGRECFINKTDTFFFIIFSQSVLVIRLVDSEWKTEWRTITWNDCLHKKSFSLLQMLMTRSERTSEYIRPGIIITQHMLREEGIIFHSALLCSPILSILSYFKVISFLGTLCQNYLL